jgi:hypothetical protein
MVIQRPCPLHLLLLVASGCRELDVVNQVLIITVCQNIYRRRHRSSRKGTAAAAEKHVAREAFRSRLQRLLHHQPKDDSGHSQTRGSVHQLVTPVLDSRNASRMLRQCFVKQVSNINVFRHSWSAEPRAIALLCMTDSLQQPGPSSSKIPGNFRPLNRS